jgi:deoxyribodipyrimidine photo-lyase
MNIFLFHRDLRIQDNTTLIHQIKEMQTVVPIFIFPPEQIDPKKNDYFSNNSVQFMIESLHELADEIQKKGGKMYFFKGETMKVLKRLNKENIIESIGFNIDYTPYARKRDKEIKEWCEKKNIICYMKEDYPLYDILNGQTKKADGTPYLVFTPFRNYCMKNLEVRKVDKFSKFKFTKSKELENIKYNISETEIDNFYEPNDNINVHGGRSNGLKILKNIANFKDYQNKRDLLTYKTTFLGAHNHFSTVSIREEYYAMLDKLGKQSGLINELHWRDFYMNITWEFPHVLKGQVSGKNQSYKLEYDKIQWLNNNKWFEAWCDGETGFPIVDAAMRQLNATGFMHNRCRMVVSSFLTKDMHIDWRKGEMYFASKLVDYDPIANSGGWLWSTGNGTDAQPYFRIFNPWSQQVKFDENCDYIKKWLPELKNIPAKELHNWWKPEIHEKWLKHGVEYFKPVLEHDKERQITLKLYKDGLS